MVLLSVAAGAAVWRAAHGAAAAVPAALPVLLGAATQCGALPHAAGVLQQQPGEQGHAGAGAVLPGIVCSQSTGACRIHTLPLRGEFAKRSPSYREFRPR